MVSFSCNARGYGSEELVARASATTAGASTTGTSTAIAAASTVSTISAFTDSFRRTAEARRAERRRRSFGERRHAGRIDDDAAERAGAGAFTAELSFVAERDVDDAALAAVHGREAEGLAGGFDAFGCDLRGHAKFFDAEGAVIVGVEGNPRMIVGVHAERFLGNVFEGEEKLGAIAEDEVDVFAVEFDDEIGSFKLGIGLVAGFEGEGKIETGVGDDSPQKFLNARAGFVNRIFGLQAFFLPSLMILTPGVTGAVLLKNHCCATPTMLLVR